MPHYDQARCAPSGVGFGDGTGRSSIAITRSDAMFRITIANKVGFVGSVKGFSRRIQGAINLQANAMHRQAAHLLKKGIRKAGFKS